MKLIVRKVFYKGEFKDYSVELGKWVNKIGYEHKIKTPNFNMFCATKKVMLIEFKEDEERKHDIK